jgi:hypothetical protein
MKSFLIPALAVGAIVAATSQAQAATIKPTPIIIDTFGTAAFTIDQSTVPARNTAIATQQSPTGIVGGERKTTFNVLKNNSQNAAISKVRDGQFVIDTGANVQTSTSLLWDGTDVRNPRTGNMVAPGLNLDLTAENKLDSFRLNLADIDQYTNIKLTVVDKNKKSAFLQKSNLTQGNTYFDFNAFSQAIDFTKVFSVKLDITSPRAIDLEMNFLQADVNPKGVPEPLTMLGSAAAIGFGAAFRRKYKKKA